jgi:hypothetical protein
MTTIRNLFLLVLAICAAILLIPVALIRNVIYKIWQVEELNNYIFSLAHGIDILGGSAIFGTTYRTISGVVGKKAEQERKAGHISSYIYPFEDFINWLFRDPTHCVDTYIREYLK